MSNPLPLRARDEDVFVITEKGNNELKAAGTSLTDADLQLLILLDGFSTVAEITQRMPGVTRADIGVALGRLFAGKLIVNTDEPDSDVMGSGFSTISVPVGFFSSLSDAGAEADGGASILKKKGYYVRIAKRPSERRDFKEGWQPTILVVDDDIDVQKLIRTFFMMEGFKVRAALKRDDIVIALRQQPAADMILLDVNLPDGDGFDILARMRQHPVLKTMPIVMLTGESTREAVLRGLQAGADGYITKPFEPEVLVLAVKSVLGIGPPPAPKKK